MFRRFIFLGIIIVFGLNLYAEGRIKPESVSRRIESGRGPEGKTLVSESEYRAVLDADFNTLVDVLSDLDGAADLFPSVKESRVLINNSALISRRILVSYKVFGIGRSYSFIENLNFIENTESMFTLESVLTKSLDQTLNGYRGVWHVERLPDSDDGMSRSLISLYSYFDYNKPFFLQEAILEAFTDNEVSDMFNCVAQAAGVY